MKEMEGGWMEGFRAGGGCWVAGWRGGGWMEWLDG